MLQKFETANFDPAHESQFWGPKLELSVKIIKLLEILLVLLNIF